MENNKQGGILSGQPSASMELYLQRLKNNIDGVEHSPQPAADIERDRILLLEAEEPRLAAPDGDMDLVDRGKVVQLYRTTMDALRGSAGGEEDEEEEPRE